MRAGGDAWCYDAFDVEALTFCTHAFFWLDGFLGRGAGVLAEATRDWELAEAVVRFDGEGHGVLPLPAGAV